MSMNAAATVFPEADWEERSPESQGVDPAKLNDAMNYLGDFIEGQRVTMAVVIRNGYMIWKGSDIDTPEWTYSATKAFASTVLGHLIDGGKCTLETRGKDYVSLLEKDYSEIMLRHFTTMTGGYDAQGAGPWGEDDGWSLTPFVPDTPQFVPGTRVQYRDDAMRMFGYVLTMIAGTDFDSYFREHIARPIGMRDPKWEWSERCDKHCIDFSNPDEADIRDATGGIKIAASDLARLGYLFLNRGNWAGEQIISANWVDEATSVQVPASTVPYGDYGASLHAPGRQGYNWWANGAGGKDGAKMWPDAPPNTYATIGAHNNCCWVIPEWNMVIVRLGCQNPHWLGNFDKRYNTFFKKVSEAIISIFDF